MSKIRIHNAQTNEIVDRDMTEIELAEHLDYLQKARQKFELEQPTPQVSAE
jgi:hypothetical protein